MRSCARCKIEDHKVISRLERCSCSAGYEAIDDDHLPDCAMVSHYVDIWPYPDPIHPRLLVKDENAQFGYRLPMKWAGWTLQQFRGRFVRTKVLCRKCIMEEIAVAGRVAHLQKAKDAYGKGGIYEDSFSKQICSQDSF